MGLKKPKFSYRYVVITCVLITIISLILQLVGEGLLVLLAGKDVSPALTPLLYVLPLAFMTLVILKCRMGSILKGSTKSFLSGMAISWPLFIYCIAVFLVTYIPADKSELTALDIGQWSLFLVLMLLIGIFEEILCRGILLELMLRKWGNTRKGIFLSAFMSSLVFGFAHLVNLIGAADMLIATIAQVLYATLFGVFFAAVYLCSQNIWVVVLLHAVYDGFAMIVEARMPVVSPDTTAPGLAVLSVVIFIPLCLYGVFLMRKANLTPQILNPGQPLVPEETL
jgi:CAAX amino terminal protease family.